ncbi:serine/threonine-protein kinase [Candidatus Uabimicrobium amorphum]|uniref:Serine/threonine protein kinase n=1 Tax=Uabimicrobium amorphum TaxID=2596890 RepID=A0A5S9IQS7_UABAM|nr:serine/threonine-protein kinase [Candidatus Uabimicrobium amorphum]BBM86204.1 serine/threonine protein kinase [Candidatus Uabimicrobium amorphum]
MDEKQFRTLWDKVVTPEALDSDRIGKTYKSSEMTFSQVVTVFPEDEESTFSSKETIAPGLNTFSEKNTVAPQPFIEQNLASQILPTQLAFQKNYQDFKEINRGGMGVIYCAQQSKFDREVAIKKMLPSAQKDKFLAESLVTAYLEHPNIIPIHDIEENEQGEILIAMKLVKGVSWKQLLYPKTTEEQEKADQYDFEAHLQILLSVCDALNYAHNKGIIHCDLKPENIMIGDYGEVLVMDWGIAVDINKKVEEIRTFHKDTIKTPMGTPCYMPPELAEGRGKDISYATDVYLLGGILYEILHKKPPRRNKNLWLTLLDAKEGNIANVSYSIPKELKCICYKAIAKSQQNRYSSIDRFKMDIERYLSCYHKSIQMSEKAGECLTKSLICSRKIKLEVTSLEEEIKTTKSSITFYISKKAKKRVECTKEKIQEQEKKRLLVNDMFLESIFTFKNALELWNENLEAQQGEMRARLEYAKFAFHNGDTHIASLQIEKFDLKNLKFEIQREIKELQKAIKGKGDIYFILKRNFASLGGNSVAFFFIFLCTLPIIILWPIIEMFLKDDPSTTRDILDIFGLSKKEKD